MTRTSPPDGMQLERTALSWQRTALTVLAGGLVLARIAFDEIGEIALVVAVFVLALSGWVGTSSLSARRGPNRTNLLAAPVGTWGAALTAAICLLCLIELWSVLG